MLPETHIMPSVSVLYHRLGNPWLIGRPTTTTTCCRATTRKASNAQGPKRKNSNERNGKPVGPNQGPRQGSKQQTQQQYKQQQTPLANKPPKLKWDEWPSEAYAATNDGLLPFDAEDETLPGKPTQVQQRKQAQQANPQFSPSSSKQQPKKQQQQQQPALQLFSGAGRTPTKDQTSPAVQQQQVQRHQGHQSHQQQSPVPPQLLTSIIMRSSNWQELAQVLQQHAPLMNAIHTSAMLHRLSRVCSGPDLAAAHRAQQQQQKKQQQQQQQQQQQLQQKQQQHNQQQQGEKQQQPKLGDGQSPRAAAAAGSSSSSSSNGNNLTSSSTTIPASSPPLPPPASSSVAAAPTAAAVGGGDAVAYDGNPIAYDMSSYNQQWQARQQRLAAAAQQRQQLGKLIQQLLQKALDTLPYAGPSEIACSVGALARLNFHPPDYVSAAVDGTQGKLGRYSSQELLHLAWGLARLGHKPEGGWVEEYCEETSRR
jgi:hypothetical protein